MNIYSQKQIWKTLLFVVAVLLVGISVWYTNTIVDTLADDERKKAKLWADAVQNKANLVKYTNELFGDIRFEERKKVELWAEATKILANANNLTDYTFVLKVVADNTTVPVILADDKGKIISQRNVTPDIAKDSTLLREEMQIMATSRLPIEISIYGNKKNYLYYKDSRLFSELKLVLDDLIKSFISEVAVNSASIPVIFTGQDKQTVLAYGNVDSSEVQNPEYVQSKISEMERENLPIEIHLSNDETNYIFYQNSFLLKQLRYYPYVQFGFVGLFILVSYWLFSISRNAEQNQVWVGMAKETAHQLGTPLSSLMAWLEILKSKKVDEATLNEINKDIQRLETITDRFSKIGAAPNLKRENAVEVLGNAVNYLRTRSSSKVEYTLSPGKESEIYAQLNVPLFDWVIENICKNAMDAMNGNGSISINVTNQTQYVYIDITDTGKGIPSSKQKTVFEPGFTTKQRGWGLGLSLAKRIIENYHNGKIFVKHSEPEKGTTFRVVLNT